jgi:hypothetical protein
MATKKIRLLKGCKPLLSFFFFLFFPPSLVLIVISCPSHHAFWGDKKTLVAIKQWGVLDDNQKDSVAIQHTFIVGWELKNFNRHPTPTLLNRNQNLPRKKNGVCNYFFQNDSKSTTFNRHPMMGGMSNGE